MNADNSSVSDTRRHDTDIDVSLPALRIQRKCAWEFPGQTPRPGARSLTHIASLLFNVPLLLTEAKFAAIVEALGGRLGFDAIDSWPLEREPLAFGGIAADGGSKGRYYSFVVRDDIALIDIMGPLVHRRMGNSISGGPTSYGDIREDIEDAGTDPNIKGVLLTVDSHGGEAAGNFDLADDIRKIAALKPLWAIADGAAYSGGYSLASQASRLNITREGGAGSIGVIFQHADLSESEKMRGVKIRTYTAGRKKDMGSPHRAPTDREESEFKGIVDKIQDVFVATVAAGRPMLSAKAIRDMEAGLFMGRDAVDAGLADGIGTVESTFQELREHIAGGGNSRVTTSGAAKPAAAKQGIETAPVAAAETPQPATRNPQPDPPTNPEVERMSEPIAGASPPESGGAGKTAMTAAELSEAMQLGVIAKISLAEVNGWIAAGKTLPDIRKILVDRAAEQSAAKAPPIDSGVGADFGISEVPPDLLVNSMKRLLAARGMKANA